MRVWTCPPSPLGQRLFLDQGRITSLLVKDQRAGTLILAVNRLEHSEWDIESFIMRDGTRLHSYIHLI